MRFVKYRFPAHMGGVVGVLLGAIWGAFLRRFAGHMILEAVLFVFGVLTINLALYYRPSFQGGTDAPSDQEGENYWRDPPSIKSGGAVK